MFQTTSSEIFVEIRSFVLINTSVGFMQQHVPLCQVRNSLFEPGHWIQRKKAHTKNNLAPKLHQRDEEYQHSTGWVISLLKSNHAATMSLRAFIRTRGCGCNWLFGSSTCHGANMFQPNCICRRKNLWQICSRSDPVTSQYVYPCISSNTHVILLFLILDLDATVDTLCISS